MTSAELQLNDPPVGYDRVRPPDLVQAKSPILVVINPNSGAGKATRIFNETVAPLWQKRGIAYEVLTTKYARHCTQELARDRSITRFKSIIAVGGDGTLAEIIEGLKANQWVHNAEQLIPLGIIPVGSGNGLAKSLHEHTHRTFTVQQAAEMIAAGDIQKLDIMEITQKQKKRVGFLAITLGLIADIDILSEPLRCLGNFRFTLGAILALWKNKVYPAQLSYLPESAEQNHAPLSLDQPPASALRRISGKFSLIMIANTSHCSSNAHTAPGAKINDGYVHVIAVRKASRWTLLKILLGLDTGEWVKNPAVVRFKTKLLHLDMLSKDCILTLDGERVPPEPLHCRVHRAAVRILCS